MNPAAVLLRTAAAAAVLVLLTGLALSQPRTARGEEEVAAFSGAVPAGGGTALLVTSDVSTPDKLVAALAAAGCDASLLTVAGTGDGAPLAYVPGAAEFVNANFPARLAAGTLVAARCAAVTGAALDLANTTFAIGNVTVPLVEGSDVQDIVPGSATKLRTTLSDRQAYGDLTGDGLLDAAAVLIHDPGGSGTFYYLAAVLNSASGTTQVTGAVLLGDRITVERVEIAGGVLTVTYLDRATGESFATTPSVRTVRQFAAQSGALVEVSPAAICDTTALGGSSFVFVTAPLSGQRVASGFSVEGCSRTFESTVNWTLFDRAGNELASGFTTGGGVDGGSAFTFDVTYEVSELTVGRLEVFEVDVSGGEGFPPPKAVVPVVLLAASDQLNGTPTWHLQSLAGAAPVAGTAITAVFADAVVGGSSGCNTYSGRYTATGTSLEFPPPFISTLIACATPVMDQEQAYLSALEGAQSFAIDGTTLTIATAAGDVVFSSEGAPLSAAEQLTTTTWQLVSLAGDALVAGTEITAQFDTGEVGGSSGCNLYAGSYTAGGTSIDFPTPFISTRMACEASIMDQEQTYLAALATAHSFAIEGSTLVLATASGDLTFSAPPTQFEFTFEEDAQGWTTGFADLPAGTDPDSWELDAGYRQLPSGLSGSAIYIQGSNHSDDLFMYLTKEVSGLSPETTYRVTASVDLATNVAAGGVGIGGSPGESVFVKVGASTAEPSTIEDAIGHLRLNVDKGNQSDGGSDMVVVGNVAHPEVTGDEYRIKTLDSAEQPVEVTTDADGRLWLIVGTDSGFEGLSSFYWSRISYSLTPVE